MLQTPISLYLLVNKDDDLYISNIIVLFLVYFKISNQDSPTNDLK